MSEALTREETEAKLKSLEEKRRLHAQQAQLKKSLRHLYGMKWYPWAKAFFLSKNPYNFLCAANQISKSSTMIRKCIHWATAPEIWSELWPQTPTQFWYFYPDKGVSHNEYTEKWVKEWLPLGPDEHPADGETNWLDIAKKGAYHDHPIYGWRPTFDQGKIKSIVFNSGVTVYFKSYEQAASSLQTASVFAMFCFPAGTPISTPKGPRPIEEIQVGDVVISEAGPKKVTKLYRQDAVTVVKELVPNLFVESTGNHPFFTYNRGWVSFDDLKPGDVCAVSLIWKLTRKLSCLKESCLSGSRSTRMPAKRITLGTVIAGFFMWFYGKVCKVSLYRKIMSFITGTLIPWTMLSRIWCLCHALNIRRYTNEKNGRKPRPIPITAFNVDKGLHQKRPRTMFQDIVLRSVARCQRIPGLAWLVERVTSLGRVRLSDSVLKVVRTETKAVYNFEVEGSHTYFANGMLVHNCDEELPEDLLPELQARSFSPTVRGYFHMVFTATLGQEIWRATIEEKGKHEKFTTAFKQQISMYDCLFYEDGTLSPWTREAIQTIIDNCKDENEVNRRVFGKFVIDSDRKYMSFQRSKNFVAGHKLPKGWLVYSGVDIGSGGTAHPAAIAFIGVKPDFTAGRVFKCWRGDGIETESGDIIDKWVEMRGTMNPIQSVYDWQAKDFFLVASRRGYAFNKAEKGAVAGEGRLNTLFKKGMLKIYDEDEQSLKLVTEFENLRNATPKPKAKDDLIDTVRFAAMAIPWDFSVLNPEVAAVKDPTVGLSDREIFRRGLKKVDESGIDLITADIDYSNELQDDNFFGDNDFGDDDVDF